MRRTRTTCRATSRRSWTAGGKVVKVDRVEWVTMPDAQTAVNALQSGDIDFMENGPYDLLPILVKDKDLKIEALNKLGLPDAGPYELPVASLRQRQGSPRGIPRDEPEAGARCAGR